MINVNPNEKILLIKRRHSFVLFAELFPFILLFLLTVFGMLFLLLYQNEEGLRDFLGKIPFLYSFSINLYLASFFVLSIILIVILHFIFIVFAHYYLDCWIITSERTIHTELRSLFSRFYSSVSHNRIQDVTVDIHGIFPMIFKYGDLKIQTAGAFGNFVFRQIPDPYKTKDILLGAFKPEEKRDKVVI
ncbi:MAG: PH domain-containing protein [Candidatus Pacebacteria bacterium]|nr:PH domain-containing protein [Candidatus Paceibacterota bacterium]MDD3728909.1 PH domain-containing protein [Candidatus Paceibacterota bacterium]MDD4201482.1 PH domain-containing protein [Candidatus Paceibacterota bacterium]MDD5445793.1 PH domain-containing protein [Candidatus Paceibacterota bacterium]